MKFVAAQSDLSAALQSVGRAVPSRPSHSILSNVLITADEATGKVNLTGFDLDLGITVSIPASVQASGEITLPARLMHDVISKQSSDSAISLDCKQEQVELRTLSGSYQLSGIAADDYPALPVWSKSGGINFESSTFRDGLKATLFASSGDEHKQILTGVNIIQDGNVLRFAATDGHRLAVFSAYQTASSKPIAITVPAKSLRELDKLIADGEIELFIDKGQLIFNGHYQLLTSRTLDGTYPAYEKLIPDNFSRQVTLVRKAFINALERVAVVAEQQNSVIKIDISNTVTISVEAQDIGAAEEQVLATEIIGEDILIAFNARYLLDGLKVMTSDNIKLLMNGETSPAVIRPDDAIANTDYLYLVMPVQVRS